MAKGQDYTDHDLLIKLDTNLVNLSGKVDNIASDLVARVTKLEVRADAQDVYHAKIPLDRYEALASSYETVRSNLKLLIFIGLPIYSVLLAIIGDVIRRYFHI